MLCYTAQSKSSHTGLGMAFHTIHSASSCCNSVGLGPQLGGCRLAGIARLDLIVTVLNEPRLCRVRYHAYLPCLSSVANAMLYSSRLHWCLQASYHQPIKMRFN